MNTQFSGKKTVLALALAATFGLAGCMSLPVPFAPQDILEQSSKDREAAQANVEPVQNAITLEEAIARALKYNLERRTRMMEEALAFKNFDVSRYDMLPKFMAQAGYHYRNNDLITEAVDSVTGQPSLSNPYISSERKHTTEDLGLTWNLLDFGVSYFNAKQNGDRVLIAAERRRKAMHILIQDVTGAFWRTASAQKLNTQVRQAILSAEQALADSRRSEAEKLRSPLDALKYQRQLLENLKLLEGVEQELASARIELANLLNVPLAVDLKVVEPSETIATKVMTLPIDRLEAVAIMQNADLREQYYNARIAAEEGKKVIARMFPNIILNYTWKYDNDKYLINQNWREAGAAISFNLFNLLSAPAQLQMADAGVALADQRRVATQMALLAQMHIARLQYAFAVQQFSRADSMWLVDERINSHTVNREKAEAQGRLESVANNTAAILSLLRRYQALSQVHAAAGKLQATLGMEPEIGSVREMPLVELTAAVRRSLQEWGEGRLPEPAVQPAATQPQAAAPEVPVAPVAQEEPAPAPVSVIEPPPANASEPVAVTAEPGIAAVEEPDVAPAIAERSEVQAPVAEAQPSVPEAPVQAALPRADANAPLSGETVLQPEPQAANTGEQAAESVAALVLEPAMEPEMEPIAASGE